MNPAIKLQLKEKSLIYLNDSKFKNRNFFIEERQRFILGKSRDRQRKIRKTDMEDSNLL